MTTELVEITSDFLDLARTQEWPEVAARVEALAAARNQRNAILVASAGVDVSGFRVWAAASAPLGDLHETNFTSVDLSARIASHLLAFFPGDQLIDAAEIEVLGNEFFTRPTGSWAVVIGIDGLASAEDLKLVEQSAWRLLVQDPPSNRSLADLRDYGVYLWSTGEPADFLSQRIQQDKEALARWLRGTGGESQILMARQLVGVLDRAEDLNRQRRTSILASEASRTKDLAATIDRLDDLRSRFNRRLDGDGELLAAEVARAMRDWSEDLTHSLDAALVAAYSDHKTIRPEQARVVVEQKLRSTDWADRTAALIRGRQDELQRKSEDLFDLIDWKLVNEVAAGPASPANYPETLLTCVFGGRVELDSRGADIGPLGAPKPKEGVLARNLVVLGLPVSLGVGFAASLVMHLPFVLPVAALAGGIFAANATRKANTSCDYEQCQAFGNEAVQHFLSRSIAHFQSATLLVAANLRKRFGDEVRKLDDALRRAMEASYASVGGTDDRIIAERLKRMREKIEALGTIAARGAA